MLSDNIYFTTSQSGLTLTLDSAQLPEYKDMASPYTLNNQTQDGEDLNELAWINMLIHTTPNGHLYYDNDLRTTVREGKDVTLVHITLSIDAIKKSGRIHPSVGCLGATIFSVPLTNDGKIHNFTQYILDHEVPLIIKKQSIHKDVSLIGIKLKATTLRKQRNYSFNYLLLGELQLDIYHRIKTLFRQKDDIIAFTEFQKSILDDVSHARTFLNMCYGYKLDAINNEIFFSHFHTAMKHVSFLGYIYFEVLSEYVQLYQIDRESIKLRHQGQLNIRHFKDLVYELSPSLNEGFDLEKFKPSIEDVFFSLQRMNNERKLFEYFNKEEFLHFIKWRLAQVVRLKVLGKRRIDKYLDFQDRSPLLGHIVHRKIGENKTMARYLLAYDQERAKTVWDNWQSHGISLIENAVMPRGEVGINPMIATNDYEIYLLDYDHISKCVIFKEKLDVTIEPSIICDNSLMGSSNNPKGKI